MTHDLAPLWLSPARRRAPLVALTLAIAACGGPPERGPAGPEGPPGVQGTPGDQGPQGDAGTAALAESTPLERGDTDCPYGGIRYDVGLDDGSNGGVAGDEVLQAGEIDHTDFVCFPAGGAGGFEIPDGPVGTAVIDVSGGDGESSGGRGGAIVAFAEDTGGHVVAWPTGRADDGLPIPTSADAYLGTEPLVVTTGQTLTPRIVAVGAENTVPNGEVFTYNNAAGANDALYFRRSGSNFQITGISIQAGATLVIPKDPSRPGAYAWVPYDIVNAGTLTTPVVSNARTSLFVAAFHYFGESTSRIDLGGPDGTASVAGGAAGHLVLVAGPAPSTYLSPWSFGAAVPGDGCAITPTPPPGDGGIYNRGVIDATPGARGDTEPSGSRSGAIVQWCATDDAFNTGAIVARGEGPYGHGGEFGAMSLGSVYNTGAIDVSGGLGPVEAGHAGGPGGGVLLVGRRVAHGGSIDASGGSIAATVSCTFGCDGGEGGDVEFQSTDGGIDLTGTIDLRGGDATGSGGSGNGGGAGTLRLSSSSTLIFDALYGPGSVDVSGEILAGGGSGATSGGAGGVVFARLELGPYGSPSGQGVALLGYEAFDASGGAGLFGGDGGTLLFQSGDGGEGAPPPPGPGAAEIGAAVGPLVASNVSSGSAVNYVPFTARGGAGLGTGGDGGYFQLRSRAAVVSSEAQVAILGAPVDLSGGAGIDGGRGGFAVADGATLSSIEAPVTARGGAGDATSGGYGGEGGLVGARSQFDRAVLRASVDATGGAGFYGGNGGRYALFGPVADHAADAHADGGAGDATGGSGGYGGEVNLWSSDTFTVLTGALTSDGGAGAAPGLVGTIEIDGFIVQSVE